MDVEITRAALALFEAEQRFALVSTLETSGSSPRHSGAAMIVRADGSIAGTVGGGALEGRAIRVALETLDARASRIMDFELNNADSAGLGMICGGRGRLLVECTDPAADAKPDLYAALDALLSRGGHGWLVTGVTYAAGEAADAAPETLAAAENVVVKRCLVDTAGNVSGDPPLPVDELQGLPNMGGALGDHTAGGRQGVYVQPVGVPGTVYVFGAGHCGKSLIPLLGLVGFRTVIVDDRAEFANAERFPDVDEVVVPESLHSAMASLPVDEQSYVVIMTRGHLFDRSVLAQALRTPARYVGMIGSKKKIAETYQALRAEGFADEDIARVKAPIGVDIGAETPEEIAVAIAAEIIRLRHG